MGLTRDVGFSSISFFNLLIKTGSGSRKVFSLLGSTKHDTDTSKQPRFKASKNLVSKLQVGH